jgi:hypothetical protein
MNFTPMLAQTSFIPPSIRMLHADPLLWVASPDAFIQLTEADKEQCRSHAALTRPSKDRAITLRTVQTDSAFPYFTDPLIEPFSI